MTPCDEYTKCYCQYAIVMVFYVISCCFFISQRCLKEFVRTACCAVYSFYQGNHRCPCLEQNHATMAGFVNVPSSFFTSAMAVLQDHNLLIFTREGRKIH